ncbi:membrane hypothetical protein [Candidatus Zixiibacteriota bacterium]|nr:membrane hypothetical protein [candidate division Zixibacteria bacterium]
MTGIVIKKSGRKKILLILMALISATGIYLHWVNLDSDPPLYFEGSGQSLSTDPYQYTFHARNKVLFGEWDPLGDKKWEVFKTTLVSGLSFVFFSIFGVSLYTANASGLILTLLAILIFAFALRRSLRGMGILAVLIFLLFNKILYVYGRLPYNENGVLFWGALIFLVFVEFRQHLWGKILLGILVTLAGMSGKIFGFLFFVSLVFSLWFENRERKAVDIAVLTISLVASTIVWTIFVYGADFRLLIDYLFSQSLGLYGFPEALGSPLAFLERLVSFGNDSRLFYLSGAIGIGTFLALVILLRTRPADLRKNISVFYLIIWLVSGILFFMVGNYRPVRYSYMLLFPMTALIGYTFFKSADYKEAVQNRKVVWAILFFFVIWIFLEQVSFSFYIDEGFLAVYKWLVWLNLIPALVITYCEMKFSFCKHLIGKKVVNALIFLLLAFSLGEFALSFRTWQIEKSYNLKEAGKDLAQILGPETVLSGPMAPSLLPENKFKGLIYAVGISKDDPALFEKFPVTHFAIDADGTTTISDEFPALKNTVPITDYWIRDADVLVGKINQVTGNPIAAQYQPTDYEFGRQYFLAGQYDSARVFWEQFAARFPDNKSVLRSLSELDALTGLPELGMQSIQKAAALYPRDFSIQMALATFYQRYFIATGNPAFQELAKECYLKVVEMNPYQSDEAADFIRKISSFRDENK